MRLHIITALIALVLIKLAHGAQTAVASLTRFARLVCATILHRMRLDRLRAAPQTHPPEPPQDKRQGWPFVT